MPSRKLRDILAVLALNTTVVLALAISATATFPRKNGKIAFTNVSGDVSTMNPDGSNVTQLTSFASSGGSTCCVAWSPDGRQLVFGAAPDGTPVSQLWIMNSDGSNQHVLLSEDSFFDFFPSFSPDGSQVVFTRCALPANHCAISVVLRLRFIVSLFRTQSGVTAMMANLGDVIRQTLISLFSARDSYNLAEPLVIQIRSQKETGEYPIADECRLHHQGIDVTVNQPISVTIQSQNGE
jgi:Tol biopolymer transport system component